MKKITTIQMAYNKGMNENVRQNIEFDTGRPFDAVLWLENFNPNLEHGTLTKRYGIKGLYALEKVSDFAYSIIEREPDRAKDDIVTHSTILGMSNPLSMNVHLFFVKRLPSNLVPDYMPETHPLILNGEYFEVEATGVIARVPEYDKINEEWKVLYTEPHSENARGLLANFKYPGWYTLGTLQDTVKYGESILFVTALDGLFGKDKNFKDYFDLDKKRKLFTDYMYPAYYWRRWDITKAREEGTDRFWNGLSLSGQDSDGRLTNASLFSRCKVMKPSMSLIREKQFKIGYIDGNKIKSVKTNEELTKENSKVNLVIWETDLLDNPYFYDTTNPDKTEVVNKKEWPVWADKITLDGDDYTVYNSTAFYFTCEVLNDKDLIDKFIEDYTREHATSTPNSFDGMDHGAVNFALEYPEGLNKHHATGHKPVIFDYKTPGREFKSLIYGEEVNEIAPHSPQDEWYNRYYKAITFGLPNYLQLKIPRPFFKGEKIPFVITATVNGVEIIVAEESYTVRTETRLSVPYVGNMIYGNQEEVMTSAIGQGNGTETPNGTMDSDNNLKHNYLAGKPYHNPPDIRFFSTIDKYTIVNFTIRLDNEYIVDANISSINIYVAKPEETKESTLFRSQGVFGISDPPIVGYRKPVLQNNKNKDYSKYKLIKRFLIKGEGKKQESWDYRGYDQHEQTETESNAWGGNGPWVWALPQGAGSAFPNVRKMNGINTNPLSFDWLPTNVENIDKTRYWTPDFIVWDYPLNKIPLVLQGSGEYYDGMAAKLIQVIKGRTFIANSIDGNGELEQSIVRYSAVQGGAISPDVFNKEDKLKVGHLEFTALVEYREQLICFNRQSNYRIIMPNIALETTWEFLDAQLGQGTFSQKTVVVTPFGMVYGNESGVWISDGRQGTNLMDNSQLGLSLISLWQKVSMNKPYIYNLMANPGEVFVNEAGFNPYLEFIYDEKNDELNIVTPVSRSSGITYPWVENIEQITNPNELNAEDLKFKLNLDYEIRLIYSFSSRNWRVEAYKLFTGKEPGDATHDSNGDLAVKTYSNKHKLHHERDNIYTSRVYFEKTDEEINELLYELAVSDNSMFYDVYLGDNQNSSNKEKINSILVTHEIGNGKDDFLLDKTALELIPRDEIIRDGQVIGTGWSTYYYELRDENKSILENLANSTDPMLLVELRNKQFSAQKVGPGNAIDNNWNIDLIEKNYLSKIGVLNRTDLFRDKRDDDGGARRNPFMTNLDTPSGINSEEYFTDNAMTIKGTGRESLTLTAPHHSKFRSARLMFASEIVAKMKTFDISIVALKRRTY